METTATLTASTVPAVLYHAASARARASILAHGIDRSRSRSRPKFMQSRPEFDGQPRPTGNYLYASELAARSFADRNLKGDFDVWAVTSDGLSLARDPEPIGEAWYASEPVPAAALQGIAFSTDPQIPYRPGELYQP